MDSINAEVVSRDSSCPTERALPRLSGRSRRGCFPFLQRCLAAVPRREAPVPDASPGAGRGAAGRHGALAGRVPRASALVFCASLAAALLGTGGSAEAQQVLIDNLGSASTTSVRFGIESYSVDAVQVFRTGTNTAGYTLTSIVVDLQSWVGTSTLPTVTLNNVTVAGSSVTLGTAVATLTTTATGVPSGNAGVTYTLPTDTSLDASTAYGVFVEGSVKQLAWNHVRSGYTVPTPAPGWSLEQLATRAHDATGALSLGSDGPGQITVNGTIKGSTNNAATGAPTITGTATVGETLTAVTTAIMDDDGLTTPGYTYQWIRVATDSTETDIATATASTYTLVTDDLGATIKVKVSFTDDASNAETLTSVATAAVAAAPDTTPPTLTEPVVDGDGLSIGLRFSETLDRSNLPPTAAFTVTADGNVVTVSGVAGFPGSLRSLGFVVSPAIRQGQAVVVTYTDPTGGNDTNAIQDLAGNAAATFTTGTNSVPAVRNSSSVAATAPGAPTRTPGWPPAPPATTGSRPSTPSAPAPPPTSTVPPRAPVQTPFPRPRTAR